MDIRDLIISVIWACLVCLAIRVAVINDWSWLEGILLGIGTLMAIAMLAVLAVMVVYWPYGLTT